MCQNRLEKDFDLTFALLGIQFNSPGVQNVEQIRKKTLYEQLKGF